MADQNAASSARWRECSQCHLRYPIEAQGLSGCCEALLVTVVSELPKDTHLPLAEPSVRWMLVERIPTLYPRNFQADELVMAIRTINENLAAIIVKYLDANDAGA